MAGPLAQIPPHQARQRTQQPQPQARLIDLRPIPAFLRGHIPGSLNLPHVPRDFPALAARLLPPGPPAILIAHGTDAPMAAVDLQVLGHTVQGELAGGFPAWPAAGLPTCAMQEMDPAALHARLRAPKSASTPRVLDVREPEEWLGGTIPGAARIPLGTLLDRLADLEPTAEYVAVCAHGMRSQQAAWLLLQRGLANVTNLTGGMAAWQEAGLPTD